MYVVSGKRKPMAKKAPAERITMIQEGHLHPRFCPAKPPINPARVKPQNWKMVKIEVQVARS